VELVDLEPSDLLEQLRAGKIYRLQQAGRALEHCFTETNLAALREIALRRTAARMARAFHGAFTALFVETPEFASVSEEDKNRFNANIRLAEELRRGSPPPTALTRRCRSRSTLGSAGHPKSSWAEAPGGGGFAPRKTWWTCSTS